MNTRFPRTLPLASALALLAALGVSAPAYAQDAKPKEDPPATANPKPDAPKPEPPIKAQPPAAPAPEIDAEAKKTLDAMVDAYAALKSFTARLAFSAKSGDKPESSTAQIAFARPNLVKVTGKQDGAGVERAVVSDGKQSFVTVSTDALSYSKSAALPDSRNIGRALQLSGGGGTGLMSLLLGLKPEQAKTQILGPNVSKVSALPDDTLDGVAVKQVKAEFIKPRPYTILFAVGKEDNLLRKLAIEASGPEAALSLSEEYTDVKVNPDLPADTFAFKPAPGAKEKVEKVVQQQFYDPRIKVGAAPLPLAGKDLKGAPLSLAAYKGKVVLVDFWATWCGPCREEIPNVVSVYNKYKGKGFDVLGVSLDDANAVKKITDFAAENKMPWKHIYDGKGWQNAVAATYGVRAIPFTMLVGKDGKIAAVGARGPELEPAVKKALAQK